MTDTIVVISAGVGTPSSSLLLGEQLGKATQRVLAAAGPGATLIQPRIATARVTCALARSAA